MSMPCDSCSGSRRRISCDVFGGPISWWTGVKKTWITAPDREIPQRIMEAVLEDVYPATFDS